MNRQDISASVRSRLILLTQDGCELPVSEEILNHEILQLNPDLAALVRSEIMRSQHGVEPASIKAMQELELVDYEPASDSGHFRFPPKGALVFNLFKAWAEQIALDRLGAYAIETPIIYNWNDPDIRAQAESFHERHYRVHTPDNDDEFILRFAGDFGLFKLMADAQLTYHHLPVRLYEFAPSFRYEQTGELSGLRRLRGFWMPDVHSFCLNLEQGLDEYEELYRGYTDLANGSGVSYAIAFRVVEGFYMEHKEEIVAMAKYSDRPVLVELLSDMKHYWVMKHEINTIDVHGGVCQVSTVQLDIKDASIYGIEYVDRDGRKRGCTIVHSSIGSPERWMFSMLENALKGEPPKFPLWLAPTQVRILPVSDSHLEFALRLARGLATNPIRVDVDDRGRNVNWRIRAAERDWVPYIIVIGDSEVAGDDLSVRIRGDNERRKMTFNSLIEEVMQQTAGMPFIDLPGLLVSKRPIFRGRN